MIAVGAPASASAQDFRPLALPDGFYQRMAQREQVVVPEHERAQVVERASAGFTAASYYNRPGGSWEDYLREWYGCEQATKGSRIPSERLSHVRSPSLVSPSRSGIGATIGGHVGTGDNLDALHDENHKACLRARGWRRVAPDAAEAERVARLTDAQFTAWAAGEIGRDDPAGEVERAGTGLPDSPLIDPNGVPRGEPSLHLAGGGDPRAPLTLGPGEGALVIAFRRPDRGSAGKSAAITLRPYDVGRAELAVAGADSDATTIASADRRAGYELHVVRLAAGHYVIDGTSVDGKAPAESNCFGAPLIEIPAGQAVYGGDWVPYHKVGLGQGRSLPDTLVLVSHLDQAKAALHGAQPALAAALQPMAVANGARYACLDPDVVLDRWSLAGVREAPAAR
ncbi:MAG TPA: hypothetical protein VI168_19190 [Croceibacterium sp.]